MAGMLTRRKFLGRSALAACSATAAGCVAAKVEDPRKPNLLFIWTDEQRADTMAAYGNKGIHTPNLNKLTSESVVFENAYVTQPVCTPSRSSVMTGLWPHTTGCTANNIPLGRDTKCLPELLDDPDYRTAYMGKWHLGDEIFAQHGFDKWVSIEDGYTSHYSKGHDHQLRSSYHHFLAEQGYKPGGGNKFSRSYCAKLDIEHCKPKFLETQACDFLRRNRSSPFILNINFLEPHMPFFGPLDSEHSLDEVYLPSNFTDPLEANEPLRYRVIRECCRAKYGVEPEKIRQLIAKYWGLVAQVDRSVGAILDTLDSLGLADNTIVVYTSDHGDMMGAHHMVEKSVMYEEAVKVPWVMRLGGMGGKGRLVKGRVSHIDMVPTLLELMGCRKKYDLPGKSLVPVIKGERAADEHVFIQWNPNSGALKVKPGGTNLASKERLKEVQNEHTRAVISPDGWKLCLSDVEKCQLFDLNSDPGETKNLFDTGRYDAIISRLTKEICCWQGQVDDNIKVTS